MLETWSFINREFIKPVLCGSGVSCPTRDTDRMLLEGECD